MGRFGTDIVYAGLAIGAIYAIYKLTKPVTGLTQSVSDSIAAPVSATSKLATDIIQGVDNSLILPGMHLINDVTTGQANIQPPAVIPYLNPFAYPIPVLNIPAAVDTFKKVVTPSKSTYSSPAVPGIPSGPNQNFTPAVPTPAVPTPALNYTPYTPAGTYQTPTGGMSGFFPSGSYGFSSM
jgi:hypothetical protein